MDTDAPRWQPRHPGARWFLLIVLLAVPHAAIAQGPAPGPPPLPPGPYVIDVRAATMGLPEDSGFYPAMPEGTLVPARGFGVDAGAHLYFGNVRGARLGAGASFAQVRGTTDAATATVRLLAPQLSINFGTADGWSYLSGGVGTADVTGRFKGSVSADAASRGSATLLALNVGGGARWFFTPHLAVGFDVRLHRLGGQDAQVGLAGTAPTFLMLASAGLSVK